MSGFGARWRSSLCNCCIIAYLEGLLVYSSSLLPKNVMLIVHPSSAVAPGDALPNLHFCEPLIRWALTWICKVWIICIISSLHSVDQVAILVTPAAWHLSIYWSWKFYMPPQIRWPQWHAQTQHGRVCMRCFSIFCLFCPNITQNRALIPWRGVECSYQTLLHMIVWLVNCFEISEHILRAMFICAKLRLMTMNSSMLVLFTLKVDSPALPTNRLEPS